VVGGELELWAGFLEEISELEMLPDSRLTDLWRTDQGRLSLFLEDSSQRPWRFDVVFGIAVAKGLTVLFLPWVVLVSILLLI
jgi:hypothetical protein